MKNNFLKNYYVRIFVNIILSAVVFLVITLFLIYNFVIVQNTNIVDRNANKINANENFLSLFIALVFGVVVFTITFVLLERKKYISMIEIYNAINRISSGNITEEIVIDTNDEFSAMAEDLNVMQIRISELLESERESEKQKNELITNIAHDLRTPLTSILGYLEIIETNEKLTDEQKKNYVNIAYEKSKRLEVLIEDLFAFTKLNYGKLSLKIERFDMVKLIEQLIQELYPLFEKAEISYEFDSSEENLLVEADPKLMVRLFENLINNAIKYGREGKKIIIKLVKNVDDTFYVSIINYGRVIPKESIKRLFDKFYRVDTSRNSKVSGSGLGLAIAKNIVDLHKGNLSVKSDKNGTEFKVTLKINNDNEDENIYND